jgi:hypothetical protein
VRTGGPIKDALRSDGNMTRLASMAFALCTAAALAQTGKPTDLPYKGPFCLADFCLEKSPLPSEKKLVAQYGPGLRIGEFRCYSAPEQNAYVHFGVEQNLPSEIVTIIVSDVPNCESQMKLRASKSPFPMFKTQEGIRLGDSYEDVVKAYGPPTSTRDGTVATFDIVPVNRARKVAPFGETALVYDGPSDELIQGIFYLRKGKVAAIYISCSE